MSLKSIWQRRVIERATRPKKTFVFHGRSAKFYFDGVEISSDLVYQAKTRRVDYLKSSGKITFVTHRTKGKILK
jgi:hypothetical protein